MTEHDRRHALSKLFDDYVNTPSASTRRVIENALAVAAGICETRPSPERCAAALHGLAVDLRTACEKAERERGGFG
jgi:hypothetical protein